MSVRRTLGFARSLKARFLLFTTGVPPPVRRVLSSCPLEFAPELFPEQLQKCLLALVETRSMSYKLRFPFHTTSWL